MGRRAAAALKTEEKNEGPSSPPLGSRRLPRSTLTRVRRWREGTSRSDPGLGLRAFAWLFEGQRLGRELGVWLWPKSHF